MAVTLHDVAALAGVSIKTVSNVVNDQPHIRAETRRRVLDAVQTLGYRPNLTARGLRSGRTGVISLIVPELRNAYFAELAEAVIDAAKTVGLSVIIEQSGGSRDGEIAALTGPRTRFVDGMIFSVLHLGEEDAAVLSDARVPIVLLGERIFSGPTDHVTMRNAEAARAATEHLASVGCSRILALGAHSGEGVSSAALRLAGYRAGLDAAGLPFDGALVREVPVWSRRAGAADVGAVLASGVPFDGVFAFNDALALGALRALNEAGVRVPGEVAVAGFDDVDEARYSLPTLTSVDAGRAQIAERAVALLAGRIEGAGGGGQGPITVLADFELVVRESTAR